MKRLLQWKGFAKKVQSLCALFMLLAIMFCTSLNAQTTVTLAGVPISYVNQAYTLNQVVYTGSNVYYVSTAGTGTAAPTFTSGTASVGGVGYTYLGTISGGVITWTIPAGVTSLQVECYGAGGGGGGTTYNASTHIDGGGGAGGNYVKNTAVSVTGGNTLQLTIGAGGAAGSTGGGTAAANNGGTGGNTQVAAGTQSLTTTILAAGGGGGGGAINGTSGAAGTVTSSASNTGYSGSYNYTGGAGGAATNGSKSGGGGSSAGNAGNGNAASTSTAGSAPTGGFAGAGGHSSNGTTGNGSNAPSIGGGGGGATSSSSTSYTGGVGGPGEIILTYTIPPTITLGSSSLTGFTYGQGSGPSSSQSFTVSGAYLTANITLTAPTDYEISTDNVTFSGSATLTQSGGTVSSTTIYVRLKAGLLASNSPFNSENVAASTTGGTTQNVSCSGTVTTTPSLSVGTQTGTLTYVQGLASSQSPASFTVTGANLTSSITVTAPTNFVVATSSGGSYSSSISLGSSGGTVYVELASGLTNASNATVSGNATITDATDGFSGGTAKSVALSGTVTVGTSYTSTQAGDWNTATTWAGGFIPTAGASVTIVNAVTLNNDQTSVTVGAIAINAGGSITFGASGKLSSAGVTIATTTALDMTGGGTLTTSGTISGAGTFTPGAGTVVLTGSNTWSSNITFNNLSITSGTQTVAATLNTNGDLSVTGGANLTYNNSSARTTSVGGNLTLSGAGGLNVNGAGSSAITITLAGTSKTITNSASGNAFNKISLAISGSYTLSSDFDYSNNGSTSRSIALTGTASLNINGHTLSMGVANLTAAAGTTLTLGSGTINTTSVQAGAIPTTGSYTSGTVVYSATAGGQTIVAANYNNLTISATSGATTWPSSGTVGIAGTLTLGTGTSTNTVTSSTISFNGTSGSQTIPALAYNNLTISNGSGVSLGGNVSIGTAGVLTLTSGIVATSSNTLTVNNTAATAVSGGSSSAFVNGSLSWALASGAATGTYTFPVGAGTAYNPLSLVTPTASAATVATITFTASNSGTADGTSISNVNGSALWSIASTAGNITVGTLNVTSSAALGSYNLLANCSTAAGTYAGYGGTVSGTSIINSNAVSITSGTTQYYGLGIDKNVANPSANSPAVSSATTSLTFSLQPNSNNNNIVIVQGASGSFTAGGSLSGAAPSVGNSFAGGTVVFNGALSNGVGAYTSVPVTGLTANTNYYFEAYSYNSSNSYSGGISISSATLAKQSDIANASSATSITATGATVTGTFANTGGTATTTTGVAYNTSSGPTTPTSSTGVLTGLTPQTQYHVREFVTNSGGTQYASSDLTFYTLSNPPTALGSTLKGTQVSFTSFSLTLGTASTFPSTGATKTGYLVAYLAGSTAPTLVASPNGLSLASALSTGTLVSVTEATAPTAPTINGTTVSGLVTQGYTVLVVPYTWDGSNDATRNYYTTSTLTTYVPLYTDGVTWTFASNGSATATGNVSGTTIVGSSTYTNIGATSTTGYAYATIGANPTNSAITGLNICASQVASGTGYDLWQSDGTTAAVNSTFSGITGNSTATVSNDGTRYVQFDVTPSAGYSFTTNNISIPITCTTPNTVTYSVAYSLDGFSTFTVLTSTPGTIAGNGSTTYVSSESIKAVQGQTLSVRIIVYDLKGTPMTAGAVTFSNVTISGTSTAIVQPSSLSFSATDATSTTLNWTNGGLTNTLVVAYPTTGASVVAPSNGTSYTANPAYGSGSSLGNGYVVYTGTGSTVDVTSGLTGSTNYTFYLYTFNGTNYDVTSPLSGNVTTSVANTVVIKTKTPIAGIVGQPLSFKDSVGAVLGTTTYGFTSNPSWLSINTTTGVVSGTPPSSAVGSVSLTLTASNVYLGVTQNVSLPITLNIAAPTYYYFTDNTGTAALDNYSNWYASNGSNAPSTIAAGSSAIFTQGGTTFEIRGTNASTANDAGTWTVSGTGSSINVGSSSVSAASLTVASGKTIVGTVNLPAAASGSNTLVLGDATIPTFGTINNASIINFASSAAQTIPAVTGGYGNLTVSNTNSTSGASIGVSLTVNNILTVNSGSILTLSALGTTITVNGAVKQYGTISFPAETSTSGHTYFAGTASFTSYAGATTIWNGCASTNGVLQTGGTGNIRVTGTQTLNASASYVFNGTTAAKTGNGFPLTCANLTVNNTAGLTLLTNTLAVTGTLTVNAGASLATGNLLTLKSTSIANTAVVAPLGSGASITGTATVERYIPAGYRGFRDLAPQVYNSSYTTGNIFTNWQEGGSFTHNGYGIFITGPTSTDANTADYASGQIAANSTTGLDYSLNGILSAFTFNNSNGSFYSQYAAGKVDSIINTKTTNLDVFTGYRVLVRGDRSFNLATTPILNYPAGLRMYNPTTVRATGNLVYGTVTYSTTGVTGTANGSAITSTNALNANAAVISGGKIIQGLSMVTNPYACPVSWTSVYNNSVSAGSNINGTWYFLDPTYGATGSYEGYNYSTGSQFSDEANASDLIQAGQAFFVLNATTSPTPKVVFEESAKQATSTKLSIFGSAAPLSKIYLELYNGATRTDGAAIAFRNDFTDKSVGSQDAYKLGYGSDYIAISDKGVELGIDGRLPATATDAIALKIGSLTTSTYQLKVDATSYISNGFTPLLYDAYKNTTTALGSGVTTVNFTVDANAASYTNRFSIIFNPSALAVNSIVASATLNNKIATITWNTVGEKGESHFEVEKSTDGKSFTSIGKQAAKNTETASYSITDNSVAEGNNYYRIKAVSETGSVAYSNIAKLTTNNSQLTTIYPNPLVGKTLNVSLSNVAAGKYVVSIYNALGQKVNEQTIAHSGGSATHALTINNTLAGGVYSVVIREAGSNQIVHQTSLSVQP